MNLRIPIKAQLQRWAFLFVAVTVALSGAGCSGEAEPTEEAAQATPFEGKIDPSYVGDWITDNKNSSMSLNADGKATMLNIAPGRGKSEAKGEWRVNKDMLLVKIEATPSYVAKYAAKLKGDSLTLTQKSTRLNIEYKRTK